MSHLNVVRWGLGEGFRNRSYGFGYIPRIRLLGPLKIEQGNPWVERKPTMESASQKTIHEA